jgi:hypothetical protein
MSHTSDCLGDFYAAMQLEVPGDTYIKQSKQCTKLPRLFQ